MQSDSFSQASRRQRQGAIAVLVFSALFSRLPVLLLASGDLEIVLATSKAAAGQTIFLPPLWAYLAKPLAWFASVLNLPAAVFFKLPALAADAGISVLLFMILVRLAPEAPLRADEKAPPFWIARAFWVGLVWAVHPLVILIGAAAGHIDSMALFAVLLAAWYVEFSSHPRSDLFGPLCLSLALSLKLWPLIMLPVFMMAFVSKTDRWRFALLALALPILLIAPLWFQAQSADQTNASLMLFNGFYSKADVGLIPGLKTWGFLKSFNPQWWSLALMLFVGLLYLFGKWRFPLLPGLGLAAMILLIAPGQVGVQFLLLPLPFILMIPTGMALRFSLVGLGLVLLHFGLNNPGAIFIQGRFFTPEVPVWFRFCWGILNLGLWIFWVRETLKLLQLCLKPARLRFR